MRYRCGTIEIFEKETYGTLASSRNAGFACFGSISEIYADIDRYGLDQTLSLVQKRRAGINKIRERYGPEAIDYKGHGGYEVFIGEDEYSREASDRLHLTRDYLFIDMLLSIRKKGRLIPENSTLGSKEKR